MFSVNLFLQLTLVTAHVAAVIFQDCGSQYRLMRVSIQGCYNRVPCYVTVGEDVPVHMEFFAGFSSHEFDQDVVIIINFINIRPRVTAGQCVSSSFHLRKCTVRTNVLSSFDSIMSVPGNMALNQRGWLEWRVVNEDRRTVLCYRVLVQTQNRLQALLRELAGRNATTPLPVLMPQYPTP